MSRNAILLATLFALALAAFPTGRLAVSAQTADPDARPRAPKWFVLRDGVTGDCRISFLIPVHGHYMDRTGLKAGGPFDTQEEAAAHRKELESRATCAKR